MNKKREEVGELVIEKMARGQLTIWVEGISPYIYNAMSAKATRELLMPKGRKTAADKAQNLKHNPMQEFRDGVYRNIDDTRPTVLAVPAASFKASMREAALEIPGAHKTQIGRLVWVEGDMLNMYGVPQMFMSPVRSADMKKTPDIRTRAILPKWCCELNINYMMPTMTGVAVSRLLETAGMIMGVGDWRQQKGSGNYGQFRICKREEVEGIITAGSMKQQLAALDNPEFYDSATAELYSWFKEECAKRGKIAA